MLHSASNFKALDRVKVFEDPLQGVTLSLSLTFATSLEIEPLNLIIPTPFVLAPIDFTAMLNPPSSLDHFLPNINQIVYEEIARLEQTRIPLQRYMDPATHRILSESNNSIFRYNDIIRASTRQDNWQHYYDYAHASQWWAAEKARNQNLRLTDKITKAQELAQANYNGEIEQDYICPITQEIMDDPVYDSSSANATRYERVAIEAWVRQHGTNPVTRERLASEDLIRDEVLASEISNFVKDTLRSVSPSI